MKPTPEELGLLEVAADLRASGNTWGTIAPQVARDEETCRHWPRRYPEEWGRLFREAQKRIVSDISIMSFRVLRQMHTSDDPKLAASCAQFIARMRGGMWNDEEAESKRPKAVDENWAAYLAYMETLTNDKDRAQHLDFMARRIGAAAASEAVADNGPVPAVGE